MNMHSLLHSTRTSRVHLHLQRFHPGDLSCRYLMKADHLVVVVSSLGYLPLRVWKMILPAMMLMWPNKRLVWSHVAGSWPVGGQSQYELWSSFVQYLCKYRENTTETINYTNNYSAVKLGDCLSVFFSSRLIYPHIALHWLSDSASVLHSLSRPDCIPISAS